MPGNRAQNKINNWPLQYPSGKSLKLKVENKRKPGGASFLATPGLYFLSAVIDYCCISEFARSSGHPGLQLKA
jgi:hypothetical protein